MSFELLAIALAAQAPAVEAAPAGETPAPANAPVSRDARDHAEDAIVVTGVRRRAEDVLGGISVLSGQELTSAIRPSIGDTLTRLPGVSASSFGPTASRPILRGLGGDRIRVLTDGIGSFDVSASSADHAVAINPLTADRIEVLRGPAALPFGSSAIGGVVNVIDSRIPRRAEEPLHADVSLGYGSAADERSGAVSLSVPVGKFVLHGDAALSRSDDLRTGGHLLSDDLRDAARASASPEIRALADLKGKLPNTKAESADYAGGVAYIDSGFNAGFSIARHTALYGVPLRYTLDPEAEVEAPRLDVEQTRIDARVEVPLSGAFSEVKFRAGGARYHHDELEPDGAIGSSFYARGAEGRIDLVQADREGWEGTSGVQGLSRRVFIEGEEKFLPDSRQKQAGIFTLQSLKRGPLRLEAGVRFEHSRLTAKPDEDIGNPALKRSFNALSLSGGATYDIGGGGWKAGLNISRSVRAPSIEELFANGPHAGTQAFEVGDPDLNPEKSRGFEASIKRGDGPVKVTATAYFSNFSNFIYQAPTGDVEDDLPVFAYRQGKARYYGFELEVEAKLGQAMGIDWSLEGVADATRATIKGFGPAPQIPPLRLLGALAGSSGAFDGRIEVERVFAQKRNAVLETETEGYTLLNAGIDWHPLDDRPELTLGLTANNLLDVVARRHASLLKDYAPLAGRDIRLTARFTY